MLSASGLPARNNELTRSGRPVAVIGVGNTLMGDDGIGIDIADGLDPEALGDDVELVIGGTAAVTLV